MREHIQDKGWFYTFLKVFVDWSVRSSFRRYQVEGLGNVPDDGHVIWASNHTNALMDPMVMLSSTRGRKVFVARADIFKKKWAREALSFLRVMPIYRIRDGIDAVKHNNECIDQATGVIMDGVPFVIFPEATHRAKHSLLKLSKGIFHIAESAIEKSNGDKPVYIQPIGVEYSDYFRFRNKVLIRFGKPANVSKFLEEHNDEPIPVAMLKMRELLTERLAEQIVYIPDDEDYDAIWEYTKLKADNRDYFKKTLAGIESREGKKLKGLLKIQAVDKEAVAQALAMRQNEPEKARELFAKVDALRLWRLQNGISVYSIARDPGFFNLLFRSIVALLGVPYYLFCGVVGCIKWVPIVLILRGVTDDAFYNTARYGVRLGLAIPALIVWALIFFLLFSWKIAAVLLLFSLPSLKYLYDYGAFFRIFISDIRWKIRKRQAPKL
ncbi:MAG: 1-acyl-sn-glycerol-3-phosphate acyltransferase [Bacteroidaceae bacterium]|nr:1-acyl-sn-glycerol-3-phosphate acyltransferase [Bacteroidaceae bacterium]